MSANPAPASSPMPNSKPNDATILLAIAEGVAAFQAKRAPHFQGH